MFGLNLNDTILIATFIVTTAGAAVGLAKGKEGRREADERVVPFSVAGAVYAHQDNCDLVEAVNGLSDTIQEVFDSFVDQLHSADSLEDLRDRFKASTERRGRRHRHGHKGERS